jgi:uncharacterized caspase-like protein/WD40 repeat protein
MAAGSGQQVLVWRVGTWEKLAEVGFAQAVQALAFDAKASCLAVGLANGVVSVVDTSTWRITGNLQGVDGAVTKVAFGPGGGELAVGTTAGEVALFNVFTQQLAWKVKGHGSKVVGLGFDVRRQALCSIDAKGHMVVTDCRLGQPVKTLTFPTIHEAYSVDFSEGSRLCCVGAKRLVVTIGLGMLEEERIHVLDLDGHPVAVLQGNYDRFINPVAISPDGSLVAGPCYKDHLLVWVVGVGRPLVMIDNVPTPKALAFSAPVGPMFLAAASGSTVRIFGLQMSQIVPPTPPVQVIVLKPDEFAGERDIAVLPTGTPVEGLVLAKRPVRAFTANGTPVPLGDPPVDVVQHYPSHPFVRSFEYQWDVVAEPKLLLRAETVDGDVAEKELSRQESVKAASGAANWGVFVGVSDYEDPEINDLRFCDADAESLWRALTKPGQLRFSLDKTRLLTSKGETRPTAANIEKALLSLDEASPEDTVLFYFAGHGFECNGRVYLAGCDFRKGSMTDGSLAEAEARSAEVSVGALSMGRLYSCLNALRCRRQVVILDACHSGGMATETQKQMTHNMAYALVPQSRGTAILVSCDVGEASYEWDEKGHGVFTYFLLDGLGGSADRDRDHLVTAHELFVWASNGVRQWSRNRQTPRLLYDIAEDLALVDVPR